MKSTLIPVIVLLVVTAVCYAPLTGHEQLNYGDDAYFDRLQPDKRTPPLSVERPWATIQPLTSLVQRIELAMFGKPVGPVLVGNLVLHLISVLLFGAVVGKITGHPWAGLWAACALAWHPLNIEPLAWASQGKVIFGATLLLATWWTFLKAVERRSAGAMALPLLLWFAAVLANPMWLAFPLALFVFHHLARRSEPLASSPEPSGGGPGLNELSLGLWSISLFGLMILALLGREQGLDWADLAPRLGHALVGYVAYLKSFFLPVDLAPIYPLTTDGQAQRVGVAALVLVWVTLGLLFAAWRSRGRLRPVVAGWLFFLIMLMPLLGIWPALHVSHADRYMYVPMMGLLIALAWLGVILLRARPVLGRIVAAVGWLVLPVCLWLSVGQLGYWKDSRTLWAHTLAVTSDNAVAQFALGRALEADNPAGAYEHYLAAAKIDPNLTGLAFRIKRYETLRDELALTQQNTPIDAKASRDLADRWLALTRQDPDDPISRYRYALALARMGQTTDARLQLMQLLKEHPDHIEGRLRLGQMYLEQGHYAAAADELEKVVQAEPTLTHAHLLLARAYTANKQIDRALKQYRQGLKQAGDSPLLLNDFGALLIEQGEYEKALVPLKRAAELAPGMSEAQNNLGIALMATKQYDAAVVAFRLAMQRGADDALVWLNLARALAQAGQPAEAIGAFEHAATLDSHNPQIQFELGMFQRKQGHWDKAIKAFEAVLAIEPKHLPSINELAWLLANNPDDAQRDPQRALSLIEPASQSFEHNNVMLLDTLAATYAELGRFDQAVATVKRALTIIEKLPGSDAEAKRWSQTFEQRLATYEKGQTLRQAAEAKETPAQVPADPS